MSSIPTEIRDRVLSKARADWPTDFEMQKYTIEKQVEAYAELKGLRDRLGENEFAAPIFVFAENGWPDDFEMELHTFKSQLEAGTKFFGYENNDIPADVLEQLKIQAYEEWPDDHEMKLHTLENQVAAWIDINSL